jgi:PEP-CTERM motif
MHKPMKLNINKGAILWLLFLILSRAGFSQGFVNLNFESATIAPTPIGGSTFPADPVQALPGWTVGGATTVVAYNDLSIGAPAVVLMGPDFPNFASYTPLQGSYSVLLQYFGIDGGPPTLSQTAVVPSGTQSIDFLIGNGESDAVVTMNGVNIPLVQISAGELAGNVSAFAGLSTQLTFSTTIGGSEGDFLYFDDIQFSPSSVPEPSTLALAAMGGLLLVWRRWKNCS